MMKPADGECVVEIHRNLFSGDITRLIRVAHSNAKPKEIDLRQLTPANLALLNQADELLWGDLK